MSEYKKIQYLKFTEKGTQFELYKFIKIKSPIVTLEFSIIVRTSRVVSKIGPTSHVV